MTKQVNALKLLEKFNPCCPDYLKDKTAREAWDSCIRGDWMLWAYARLYPDRKRELILAKGLCANTVRHLMQDQRSIKAVDTAIAYGRGEATEEMLKQAAAAAAYAADDAADADAADDADAYADAYDAAAYAAYAATAAAAAVNAAATAANVAVAVADVAADARLKNQKQTADICRQYLTVDF